MIFVSAARSLGLQLLPLLWRTARIKSLRCTALHDHWQVRKFSEFGISVYQRARSLNLGRDPPVNPDVTFSVFFVIVIVFPIEHVAPAPLLNLFLPLSSLTLSKTNQGPLRSDLPLMSLRRTASCLMFDKASSVLGSASSTALTSCMSGATGRRNGGILAKKKKRGGLITEEVCLREASPRSVG